MAYEFKLPDLGEGLTEGEVARWLVAEGDEIAEDDLLVEIQTDKATVDIPSPYGGTVLRIMVAEGEVAPVGAPLVLIGEPGEAVAEAVTQPAEAAMSGGQTPGHVSTAQTGQTAPPRKASATPLVRRIAREAGVDLETVTGTGPGGRITEADVRAAAEAAGSRAVGLTEAPDSGGAGLAGTGAGTALTPGRVPEGRREKLRGVRRLIAEHMARAHREIPPVTWVDECDFERVDMERLVAVVVKASALALQEFPELNARLEGEEIVYLDRYDIGVAVQTDAGLVVPVVRGCDERSVDEIHTDVQRLADGARAGTLAASELRGSTFTVTSAGKLAGLFQTPIVNHPEVAILGIGRIGQRPVVRDGEIVVRRMGNIAVTFDHRVVDGARAAAFGLAVIQRIKTGLGDGPAR